MRRVLLACVCSVGALVPASASADVYYRADSSVAGTNVVLHVDAAQPFNYLSLDPSDNSWQLSNPVVTAGNLPCEIHTGAQDIGPYLRCGKGQHDQAAIPSIEVHFQLSPCCTAIANKLTTFDGNQGTNTSPPIYESNIDGPTAAVSPPSDGMPRPPSDSMPRPTNCITGSSARLRARSSDKQCPERTAALEKAWEDAKFWSATLCSAALIADIVSGVAIFKGGILGKGGGVAGGATASKICWDALAREQDAARDLNNDPPDARYAQVALTPALVTVPGTANSCGQLPSSRRAKCRVLFPRFMRDRALVRALLDGIYTTQNRFTTARTAGDEAGVSLQNAVLKTYDGSMVAAYAAEERDGKSLTALLRRAGVRYVLPAANVQAAFTALGSLGTLPASFSSGLRKVGIDPASFHDVITQALDGVTARRVDLVALFSRHVSMSGARTDYRTMTLVDVRAILNALKAQGALKGKTAAKLAADLAAATKAKSAKKRRAALTKLIGHAKAKHTKAGDFLATAAGGVK